MWNYLNHTWENYYKKSNEYNNSNKLTFNLIQLWNINNNAWLNNYQYTYEYAPIGDLIAKDSYNSWDTLGLYFKSHRREEYICAQLVNSQDIRKSNDIQIYPNPINSNFLKVMLQDKSNFEFVNLSGQILIKGVFNEGNNTLALNQNITNGFYFLKIDGKSFKVVVER
jgi:hypothetical protein